MSEAEMRVVKIEEFSRLQDYMEVEEKGSEAYKLMHKRYLDLKAILSSFGVNVVELDRIKD